MAIIVEHEKRRAEILEAALDIFVEEGFVRTTYAKIASRCGITRTTLYTYFHNKREIFQYSIKQLMARLESAISDYTAPSTMSAGERLERCMRIIITHLEGETRLLDVVLDYLAHSAKKGIDPDVPVRKRTIRLRHILSSIIIDGIKSGEFSAVSVKSVCDVFYGFLEVAIFRLTVLKKKHASLDECIALAVQKLKQ